MKIKLLYLAFFLLGHDLQAQVSSLLSITPRLQWPNANGYCGETSIQMCGLYFGNYISQDLCRTVAGGEVLIYVNDTVALKAFSFTFKEWDPGQATPQYQSYLDWTKQYLFKKQPVIITVYIKGLSDPDYDHILPAIGFSATTVNTYTGTDQLTYNSCFDTASFIRPFSTLYDTRAMSGNGATYNYCIPENVNYGVAVTGIKDPGRVTRPVHLSLDSISEPNVSLGAPARLMKAQITADSLTPGQSYALLRYNNYLSVPSSGFSPSGASSAVYFTASAINKTVRDSFMSNTGVFYRCIPYVYTGITELANAHADFQVFPNPSSGSFRVLFGSHSTQVEILNSLGQTVQKTDTNGQEYLDMNLPENGIYFIRLNEDGGYALRKVVISR